MRTVLVVDDEPRILEVVRDYLVEAGYRVIVATNGADTLMRVRSDMPDLIILDLGLPDRDGLDITREIRRSHTVPIIMLTARTDEVDRVVGLELGADDYISKPFSPRELTARVRGVFRRMDELTAAPTEGFLHASDLTIDLDRRHVSIAGRPIELTATEFDLLVALARTPGRVYTRSQMLEVVHGVAIESYERAIDSHVKNIRRKIELDPHNPRYLTTVHGVGYRFKADIDA